MTDASLPTLLHILEPRSATPLAWQDIDLFMRQPFAGISHRVLQLGFDPAYSHNAIETLHPTFAVSSNLPSATARRLRGVLATWSDVDAIHAWSIQALTAVGHSKWSGPLIGTLPPHELTSCRSIGKREQASLKRASRLLCGSIWERDQWSALGCPLAQLQTLPLSPLVQNDQTTTGAEIRRKWALDDATLLLGSLADSARCVDPMHLVFLCGALAVAGYNAAAIVPRNAPEIERALRFTERHGCTWRVVVDEGVPNDHLYALDIGVWNTSPADRVPGLRVLECARMMNLPILATDHPASARICSNL